MPSSVLLISFGISFVMTVADKVPSFDVTASCKAVAKFGLALAHSPEACVQDENSAHAELVQKWSAFHADDRSRCVSETMVGGDSPSYVEILTCLQLTQEAEAEKTPLVGASKTKRGMK
jgi:hypothetical protein